MACVNVCPVGIDIRDGQQLECITCALCIDACDDMMAKIGKPRGLIDYMALSDEAHERAGQPPKNIWKHILRPRTIMYTALWSLVGFALLFALFIRSDIDLTVAPVRNPTFVTMSDGTIRNTYDVRLRNKHGEERPFNLSLTGDPAMLLEIEGVDGQTVTVAPDTAQLVRVYITAAPDTGPARTDTSAVRIWVEDLDSGERAYKDTSFNGRGN
jgi:cytochrome c oxidase accessory protein FixG